MHVTWYENAVCTIAIVARHRVRSLRRHAASPGSGLGWRGGSVIWSMLMALHLPQEISPDNSCVGEIHADTLSYPVYMLPAMEPPDIVADLI